jgi:hypothetical protein
MVSLYYLYLHNSNQFNQSFDRWVKSNLSFSDYNKNFFILESLKKLPKLPDLYVRMENFKNDINSLWFVKENFDFLEQILKIIFMIRMSFTLTDLKKRNHGKNIIMRKYQNLFIKK